MRNVLITGCAGYIGTRLTQHLLQAGYSVVGIDNLSFGQGWVVDKLKWNKDKFNRKFHFIEDDVRYDSWLKLLDGTDVIIHLAALVGAPLCNKFPDYVVNNTNVRPAARLLEKVSKEQLIIYPNTNSGYGVAQGEDYCTEESPITPVSSYGVTKCEAEKIVLQHENSVVFRLATVFGTSPRMRFDLMVNDFVYKACLDKKIDVFEPQFRRNFIHIQDVCEAFEFAMHNEGRMRGNVYNLGLDDANTTKGKLAKNICNMVGGEVTYKEGKDPDKRDYNVSSQKLYNLGFKPRHSLEMGVKEVSDLCRQLEIDFDGARSIGQSFIDRMTRNA